MTDVITIGIPKPIADEIYNIIATLGYHSLTEFCVEGVRVHLEKKRWEYERKLAAQEDAIVKKHAEGDESIEHQWTKEEAKP